MTKTPTPITLTDAEMHARLTSHLLGKVGFQPTVDSIIDHWSSLSMLAERHYRTPEGRLPMPEFGKIVDVIAKQNTALSSVFTKAAQTMQAQHEAENEGPTIEFINGHDEPKKEPPPQRRRR